MKNLIQFLVCLLLVIAIFFFGGCSVQKEAAELKKESVVSSETLEDRTKKTFDYGVINTEDATIDYTPADPTKLMKVVGPKGDTIVSKNAKISYGKKKVVEQRNEVVDESYRKQEQIVELLVEEMKEWKKEKEFQTKAIIYFFVGLAIFIILIGGVFFWYVKKQLSALSIATLNKL